MSLRVTFQDLLKIIGGGEALQFLKGDMKLYLAGEHPVQLGSHSLQGVPQILESFYYCRTNKWIPKLLPYISEFLLDSGAFSFLSNSAKEVDWDEYVEDYARFINKYNINLFFEVDIDPLVGLKEVERLRAKLEALTGKKPIPVWHKSRGKDYFIKMC